MITLLKQNMSFEYGLISKSKKESGVEKAKSLFSLSLSVLSTLRGKVPPCIQLCVV